MILEKLAIEGFKAISAPVTVRFPSSGIIGVLGPNGTGKSTLLETIEFALFGPTRPAADKMNQYADLISWGEEKAKVTLDFAIEQKRYRIQRRITKSGNQIVKLSPEVEGSASFSSGPDVIEGISEVGKAIETILGTDRNTFAMLLSVKQKDLDLATDAGRSERQLFVNKLLGCESFDMAINRIQKERELVQSEINAIEKQLQRVQNNKRIYEKRVTEKQDLERMLSNSSPELAATQGELDALRSRLESHRWRMKFDSLNDQLASERRSLLEISNEQQELSTRMDNISRYETTIQNYKAEFDRLRELLTLFKTAQETRSRADQRLLELQADKEKAKAELSSSELALLAKEENTGSSIAKEKRRTLAGLIVLLTAGAGVVALSIFTNPIFFIAGIAALGISVLLVKRYETIEKYLNNESLRSIAQELHHVKAELSSLDSEDAKLSMESKLATPSEIAEKLSLISRQIEIETGAKNIDELYSMMSSLKEQTTRISAIDIERELEETKRRIQLFEKQISDLDAEKDQRTDYSLKQEDMDLTILQEQYVVHTANSKMLESQVRDSKSVLDRVQEDLKILKADNEEFPILQSRLGQLRNELQLLVRLEKELSLTSEDIRNKNFPTFAVLINRIIPLVMSQKYSSVELGSDYTFRIFSQLSGKYEEVNVYSSGIQDRFWLALRLVFAQTLLSSRNSKDKPCILLDDVVSTSDAERKRAIFRMLRELQTAFSQIIVASHEDIGNDVNFAVVLSKNEEGFIKIDRQG